jgi:aldose 1-epimerase
MIYQLRNRRGLRVKFLDFGGTIMAIEAPDRDGQLSNVALGFASEADYARPHPYLGALVGRYSGRIGRARFPLDGREVVLSANSGANHIAGGHVGFDKRVWTVEQASESEARLTYQSPDGEEGFPGALSVGVRYAVGEDDSLTIAYEATTDAPTVLNLTNHTYFNLAGEGSGSIEGHVLTIDSDRVLAVDQDLIPTGEFIAVEGTPLDFRTPSAIGARIRSNHPLTRFARGYDCSYALGGSAGLRPVAKVYEPTSGRRMTVETTEPSMAFYSGNFLDGGLIGASGRSYRQGDGFTLEPRRFPDSPNHPRFPSTVLRPGETFRAATVYRFSSDAEGAR